jgi:hypothetical protein
MEPGPNADRKKSRSFIDIGEWSQSTVLVPFELVPASQIMYSCRTLSHKSAQMPGLTGKKVFSGKLVE